MAVAIKELLKDVNFDLRLAECIVCVLCIILYGPGRQKPFTEPLYWSVHGWLLVSAAFLLAYEWDQRDFELEVLLIVLYCVGMKDAVWKLDKENVGTAIIVLLMFVDLIFLIAKRAK